MLELTHIHFGYTNEPPVLEDLSLSIGQGSFSVLVGASGSGKTTLLKIIAGLQKPTSGQIRLEGRVSMVFQNGALLPWQNVSENVSLPLLALKQTPREIAHKVKTALEQVGLIDFKDKFPRELSGGQRQRVGIARALVVEPDILLLDEPFSALDIKTAESLRLDLLRIWQDLKITVVMVSHSVEEAVELAEVIYILKNGRLREGLDVHLSYPRHQNGTEYLEKVLGVKRLL